MLNNLGNVGNEKLNRAFTMRTQMLSWGSYAAFWPLLPSNGHLLQQILWWRGWGKRIGWVTVILLTCLSTADAAPIALRAWSIETSIEAKYFCNPADGKTLFANDPINPILPSPDGTNFAVMMVNGDLSRNLSHAELRIYDTNSVLRDIEVGLAGSTPRDCVNRESQGAVAISSVKWSRDSQLLLFESREIKDISIVTYYSYNLKRKDVTKLWSYDSVNFPKAHLVAWRDSKALYVDYIDASESEVTKGVKYPGEVLHPDVVDRILTGKKLHQNSDLGLFVSDGNQVRLICRLVQAKYYNPAKDNLSGNRVTGEISPDGRCAIAVVPQADSIKSWLGYDKAEPTDGAGRRGRFLFFDLVSGKCRSILDTPCGLATGMGQAISLSPDVMWSPNGEIALLINAAMPLGNSGASTASYLLSYKPSSGSWEKITPIQNEMSQLIAVKWAPDGQGIQTEWRDPAGHVTTTFFVQNKDGWKSTDKALRALAASLVWQLPKSQIEMQQMELKERGVQGKVAHDSTLTYPPAQPSLCSNGLSVVLEESPNTAQRVVASAGGKKITLIDVDPGVARAEIAISHEIEWTTSDGHRHFGILTLPVAKGEKAPALVVQPYYYMPNVFRPDGCSPTGQQKQPLVSRGIAVLEVSIFDYYGPMQIALSIKSIESAISYLERRHLIDPSRLGISGFSWGGAFARAALLPCTRYRFLAAVANDSNADSYTSYITDQWGDTLGSMHARPYPDTRILRFGGRPSDVPDRWLAESPELSASHATGALLEVINGWGMHSIDMIWPYILGGAFREAGRPIEFLALSTARHSLVLPVDRYTSIAANVDWLDFWLNDHERTEPCFAAGETQDMLTEKYTRWRKMKTDWELQQAWEAAGHPAGSIPAKDFKVPEKNSGTLKEEPKPEPTEANKN